MRGRVALDVLHGTLVGLYPVAVWWGLSHASPRVVALLVFCVVAPLLALRLRHADKATFWTIVRIPLVVLAVILIGAVLDDARAILAMPVIINAAMLAVFGVTLRGGATPMIERFARLSDPHLTPPKIAHCRQFTVAWTVFFAVNASLAAGLAFTGPLAAWATYTGLIAYGLMGSLFAAEFIVRRWRFREFGSSLPDRVLARWMAG